MLGKLHVNYIFFFFFISQCTFFVIRQYYSLMDEGLCQNLIFNYSMDIAPFNSTLDRLLQAPTHTHTHTKLIQFVKYKLE